jgi:lactate racemase-like protein
MKVHLQYGHEGLHVELPSERVKVIEPTFIEGLADEAAGFVAAVREPIGGWPLRDCVAAHERVAIVIPDITRPLPTDRLLPWVLAELGVVVLAPPIDGPAGAILGLLEGGESWSTSALARALGSSQRTVQRAPRARRNGGGARCRTRSLAPLARAHTRGIRDNNVTPRSTPERGAHRLALRHGDDAHEHAPGKRRSSANTALGRRRPCSDRRSYREMSGRQHVSSCS